MMSATSGLWTFYVAFLVISLGASGASHGVSWAVVVAHWFRRKQRLDKQPRHATPI